MMVFIVNGCGIWFYMNKNNKQYWLICNYTDYANWWEFSNWDTEKVVNYKYRDPIDLKKFSHTPNITDEWKQNWNYPDNLNTNEIITIPWAKSLKVTIKHRIESIENDWLSMWKWAHPDYSAVNNYDTSIIWNEGKLWWSSRTQTNEYIIEWDTVTLSFKSNESVNDYWYYAIVEDAWWYTANEKIWKPNNSGSIFLWWYETWSIESYDFSQEISEDKKLYAKWWNLDDNQVEKAMLLEWKKFNSIIKTLANWWKTVKYNERDYRIKWIERSIGYPENGDFLLVSTNDSAANVIAWYDGDTKKIKYYTNAKEVCINEDASYMFYGLKNLKSIRVDEFSYDYTKNMNYMFAYSFTSSEWLNLDFSKLNLLNLESMDSMFYDSFYEWEIIKDLTINFSKANLKSLNSMESMFGYLCAYGKNVSWVKIDFSEADLRNATSIKQMFYHLWYSNYESIMSWVSIDLSKVKLYNVNSIDEMFASAFRYDKKLEWIKIDLSEIDFWSLEDNSNMLNMNSRFSYFWVWLWSQGASTVSWITIDFSDANLSRVQNISSMFYCALQSNESVQWIKIDFSNADMSNVTNMNDMFNDFIFWYNVEIIEWITINFSKANLSNVMTMSDLYDHAFAGSKILSWVNINYSEVTFWRIETNNW